MYFFEVLQNRKAAKSMICGFSVLCTFEKKTYGRPDFFLDELSKKFYLKIYSKL